MTNKHYIAITIGPILKTLEKAEKTRELWGASYLFSYLCRNLVKEFNQKGIEILLPNPDAVDLIRPGVGLYPDRIMLHVSSEDFEKVTEIVKSVKENISNNIYSNIIKYPANDPYARLLARHVKKSSSKNSVLSFLGSYLQAYTLSVKDSVASLNYLDKEGDPDKLPEILSMNIMLDHVELRSSIASFDPDPLKVFLRGINHSFLLMDAFHEKFKHFPSLPEITTTELRFVGGHQNAYDKIIKDNYDKAVEEEASRIKEYNKEDKDFDQQNIPGDEESDQNEMTSDLVEEDMLDLIFQLPEVDKYKRTYHKYVAIVHADGDRMGKLIGSLDKTEIYNFSKDLIDFAQKANEVIAGKRFTNGNLNEWGYGGAPIYIGGDELVFFAPVASRDNAENFLTIFDLIAKIDLTFDEVFNEKDEYGNFRKYKKINTDSRPCMTYGVSITYVKYPLREAYKQSLELMKSVKNDDYKSRNRVNFKVQKHSGQWFGGVLDKNDTIAWKYIRELLDTHHTKNLTGNKAAGFINSVSQKLRFYQSVIEAISKSQTKIELQTSMTALFKNVFDEDIHSDKEVRDYLDKIRDLLIQMLISAKDSEGRKPEERIEEVIDTLHGILRFIHFVRDDEFKNENKKKHEAQVHS